MGTRCNIKIKTGDTTLWIYRHWDGYPAETGVDLARKLVNVKTADEFIAKLLKDDAYEVTTDQHGDIEYLYTIKFMAPDYEGAEVYFEVEKREGWGEKTTFDWIDNYYRNQSEQDDNIKRSSYEYLKDTSKSEVLKNLGYYFRAALKMQIQSAEHQLKQDAYFHQLSDIEED